MNQGIKQLMLPCVLMACVSAYGYANPVEGGAAQTVTNDWNVEVPWLIVGANSGSNTLVVADGAAVSNSIGYIGHTAPSFHNRVAVTGSGSTWSNSMELSVGYAGGSNSLTVAAGGTVTTPNAYIGNLSDGNQATVTGTNSLLDATTLHVGHQGDGNSLLVTDGGAVESDAGTIGYWIGSDGNSATVQSNGVWKADELNVGEYGSGNQLTVGAGGLVDAPVVNVGVQSLSSSNTISVYGSGALLDTSDLYIGGSADGAGGTGNVVQVQSGGTIALDSLNVFDDNSFELNAGGTLAVSSNFNASISGFNFNAGGTLEVGGELTGLSWNLEENRTLILQGEDADWSFVGIVNDVRIGSYTQDNTLEVLDGGNVTAATTVIGTSLDAGNNLVEVSGDGSRLYNLQYLVVGKNGDGNQLLIQDGANVYSGGHVYIGESSDSGSNLVVVSGADSIFRSDGDIQVGYNGDGNQLLVESGAAVLCEDIYVGEIQSSSGNLATITGSSSTLVASQYGWVGAYGSDNRLEILDGGSVSCPTAWIGAYDGADGNQLTVSGNRSSWSGAELVVGYTGTSNRLEILNGGVLSSSNVFVGVFSDNNDVNVSDSGSAISNLEDVVVGYSGSYNSLSIRDGARVYTEEGYVGSDANAAGNAVLVSGSGSTWQNYEGLYLGGRYSGTNWINGGTGNSLTVEDGGLVLVGDVSGVSSIEGDGVIAVGDGAEMMVANQSMIGSGVAYIGAGTNGNSEVTVQGGSVWSNSASLYVGWSGSSNRLELIGSSLVSVGEDLVSRNYSTIDLDPDSGISVAGDYYQDSTSTLRFGVETNTPGAPLNALLAVGGTAEFEAGAGIEYASNVGELQFDRIYTNKLIEADTLVVAGITNANSLDLELLDASGSLVDVIFWEDDQDIYALAGRVQLSESAGFEAGSMMERLSGEIDDLSLLGNDGGAEMINLLNTLSGEEQNAELTQQYERGAPSYLHIQGMTDGLREITRQTSRFSADAPGGAAGPSGDEAQGMRGWVKTYGRWGERSAGNAFSGYDLDVYGTVVGVDWIQGDVLVGVAGGYARSDVEQEDGDSSSANTCYGAGYVSMKDDEWFGTMSLAFGRSRIEDASGSVLANTADYTAADIAFYFGAGREVGLRGGKLILKPEGSILLSGYMQEDYTEEGLLARKVASYERIYAQSGLGATLAWRQEVKTLLFYPEIGVRWLHEFNADEDTVDYTLVGGTQDYSFATAGTDEDLLETGMGLTCMFNDQCSLGVDVDWVFGEDYDSYALSGRLIYEF